MRKTISLFIPLLLFLSGCPDNHGHGGHDHGAESHGGGGDVVVPGTYGEAVTKIEERSQRIEALIREDKLSEVHAVAADIKKIAEELPRLAKAGLPAEALREVNVKATELAGMFGEIDAAADAGKKEETVAVHDRMKALIAVLRTHADASHGGAPGGEQPAPEGAHGTDEEAGHGGHDH